MKYLFAATLAVSLTTSFVRLAGAQPTPLTNADVIRFVAMGMRDQVVNTLISEAQVAKLTRFDLSPSAVSDLVSRGVSPAVIAAMRQPSNPTSLAAGSAAPRTPEVALRAEAAPPPASPVMTANLPPDPAGAGKWTMTNKKNQLNDHEIVTAMLRAEGPVKGWLATATPILVVRCQTPLTPANFPAILPIQPGLEVYVVTDMPANVENAEGIHQLQVRFDDQPAHGWGGHESTDRKSLFIAPAFATEMIVTKRTLSGGEAGGSQSRSGDRN
jgi:hypothetical protein